MTLPTLRIVWAALLFSQLIYVVTALQVTSPEGYEGPLFALPDLSSPIHLAMTSVAAVVLVAALVLPRLLVNLASRKLTEKPAERRPLDGGGETSESAAPAKDPFKPAFVPMVLRLALFESIALFGFVLAVTQREPALMAPFLSVSLLGFAGSFPDRDRIGRTLRLSVDRIH